MVKDCQQWGAEGITLHCRSDERHIRSDDLRVLKGSIWVEYNIEGYPDARYMGYISRYRPTQATLVPDGPDVQTSNAGWDFGQSAFLKGILHRLRSYEVRSSLFVEPNVADIDAAHALGADRVELYTGHYALCYDFAQKRGRRWRSDASLRQCIDRYQQAAQRAYEKGLGVNAGHDLSKDNLSFFLRSVPHIQEVSIGHALISDALYVGMRRTIAQYLRICHRFSV